jgi:undecaprenyl diphosphate synthase
MRELPRAVPVDEKSVAGVLYEPADVEPDLVLVLGPPTRLPPSLVWELAYGELVFVPIPFAALHAEHLAAAIEEYHGRRRRFGGLDS